MMSGAACGRRVVRPPGLAKWAVLVGWALLAGACSDAAGPEIALVIDVPPSTEITVGDFLTLMVTATSGGPLISWASSDESIASVAGGGAVEAKRPGTVTMTASAEGATSAEIVLTVVERPGGYVADEIDYFLEIAFGSEFGGATSLLRRWPSGSGPLIRVNGTPSTGDREVLDSVIAEINRLAPDLDIELVADFPTVEMHFVPQSDFATLLPQAPPGNNGLVWLWWGEDQYLFQSVVLISTATGEALRAHIIREEVTQMLGLLQDSFRYPQSIFYQAFSDVTEYLPINRAVIDLLHRPELRVGMTTTEAARVARTLLRTNQRLGVSSSPARASLQGRVPFRGVPGSGGSGTVGRSAWSGVARRVNPGS